MWQLSYPQERNPTHYLTLSKTLKLPRRYKQHRSRGLKQLWKSMREQRNSQDKAELYCHYVLQETEIFKEEAERKSEAGLLT